MLQGSMSGKDSIVLNLNPVYNHTYESGVVFSQRVDYAQPPVNMKRYGELDQARIRARMAESVQQQP